MHGDVAPLLLGADPATLALICRGRRRVRRRELAGRGREEERGR